jgi:hypothetical protein
MPGSLNRRSCRPNWRRRSYCPQCLLGIDGVEGPAGQSIPPSFRGCVGIDFADECRLDDRPKKRENRVGDVPVCHMQSCRHVSAD